MKNIVKTVCVVGIVIGIIIGVSKYRDVIFPPDKTEINNYKDSLRQFKDKYDRVVSEKTAIVLSEKQLNHEIDSIKAFYKGMKPDVVIVTKDSIVYRDTGTIHFKPIPFDFKRKFSFEGEFISFNGEVNNMGVKMLEIALFDKESIIIGTKRDSWLSRPYSVIRVNHTNKYFKLNTMQTYKIYAPDVWWDKWYIYMGVGIITGVVISN